MLGRLFIRTPSIAVLTSSVKEPWGLRFKGLLIAKARRYLAVFLLLVMSEGYITQSRMCPVQLVIHLGALNYPKIST